MKNLAKKTIRKIKIDQRNQLLEAVLHDLSVQMCNRFLMTFHAKLLQINTIHVFLSNEKRKEPNTHYLIKTIQEKFKKLHIVVPKCNFETKTFNHILLEPETEFETNKYGIEEPKTGVIIDPSQINIILVPLLAFDQNGHRLGYGGGFYDKALAQLNTNCIKVGYSLFEMESELLPIELHDIALNCAIWPNGIIKF